VWVAGTKISLVAPAVRALSTGTTQSSRPPVSETCPSPTMLWTVTQQGGLSRSIAWSIPDAGRSRSMLVGVPRSYSGRKASGLSRTASSWINRVSAGARTVSEASRPTPSEASSDPLWGVAMQTIRLTNGCRSKK
jgi:hypothetical protein